MRRRRGAREVHIALSGAVLAAALWLFAFFSVSIGEAPGPALIFAAGLTVLDVLATLLVLGEVRRSGQREARLSEELAAAEAARAALEQARDAAEARTRRLRSAREFAEELSDQKSRFAATVSHEIRTPLNAVLNSLTLLDRSGLSPFQRRLSDIARQAGDSLLVLIDDILELSKMESGRLALRASVFEVRPILQGVLEMFRVEAEPRGIRLELDVSDYVPAQIRTDRGRLRQVLMNLVGNAAKFSLPGVVTLRAGVELADQKQRLVFAVHDRGPPIPEHEAAQLFRPFSRLEAAHGTGISGTGLGLAICERLTRLMGGQIGVRASAGRPDAGPGNEFWLTLPLDLVQAPLDAERGAALGQPAGWADPRTLRPRRANVLLVEDIAINHLLTASMLRGDGHRVDVATSGAEALHLLTGRPYDLVLMDLMMPGMTGEEAARRIRALPGPGANAVIVALTAHAAPEDRIACLNAGMDEMLSKPLRPEDLDHVLALILRPTVYKPAAPGPAERPEQAILNLDRVAEMRRGVPAAKLERLVELCLADMQDYLATLQAALDGGSCDAIEAAAHAVVGMAASYGFAGIERRLRAVVEAARSGDPAGAAEIAADLTLDLAHTTDAIRGVLGTPPPRAVEAR